MKKKSVRKVSSVKKIISKSPQKKKKSLSLRTWLIGSLVFFATLVYILFKLQPQGIKVLELSGKIEDYIPANPIDINIVQSLKNSSIPKSEDPTAYAMAVANQYVRQQVAANKEVDPEKVKIVTQQATREAYEDGAASGAISTSEAVAAVKVKDPTGKTQAEKDAEVAAEKINSLNYVKNSSGQVVVEPKTPTSSQPVTDKNTCQTSAGFSVYEGETMIGQVVEGKDSIVRCSNGSWTTVKAADGTSCFKGDTRPECKITVKPIYQQQAEGSGANCYVGGGSVVVGNGSVVDSDGSKGKQCRGTKDLVDVVKYDEKWLTPQEAQNIENFKKGEEAKRIKEEAERDVKAAKDCDGTYNAETNVCTPNDAPPKDGANTYSRQDVCESNRKDKTKESCIRSADNPNLWMVVPKGTTTVNSGVPNKISSEVNPNNSNNFKGSTECEAALKLKGSGYSCEPIAGGNYYKLTPVTQLPAPQRDLVPTNFGATPADGESSNTSNTNSQDSIVSAVTPRYTALEGTPIIDQEGITGGSVDDPKKCKYAGAVPEVGGTYTCPKEPIETLSSTQTFWAVPKPGLNREASFVQDKNQCITGMANSFIEDNSTKYYCLDENAKYVNPATGLRVTGSSCDNNSQCDSGSCLKRYRFLVDAFAADICE